MKNIIRNIRIKKIKDSIDDFDIHEKMKLIELQQKILKEAIQHFEKTENITPLKAEEMGINAVERADKLFNFLLRNWIPPPFATNEEMQESISNIQALGNAFDSYKMNSDNEKTIYKIINLSSIVASDFDRFKVPECVALNYIGRDYKDYIYTAFLYSGLSCEGLRQFSPKIIQDLAEKIQKIKKLF